MDDRVAFVAEEKVEFWAPAAFVPSYTRCIETQLKWEERERDGVGVKQVIIC